MFENGKVFLGSALFLTVHYMLINFEKLVQLVYAIGNISTVREIADLWMHPHLFRIESE